MTILIRIQTNNCPFTIDKDYKIVAKSDGTASWAIQEVDKSDSTNCKILLSPASKSGTGTTTGSTTGAGTTRGGVTNQKQSEPILIKSHRCYKSTLVMQFQIFKPPLQEMFSETLFH